MEKVRLGRTDLIVTRMGWGGIPIQRVGEAEAVSVIRAVVNMGVDLLDTARSYTTSERRIGLALKDIKKPVILSTKSHEKTGKIYDDVMESLQRLGVRKIHIYHLHNITTVTDYEKAMGPGGAYEGLMRAKENGFIDHIALSSHSLDMLERGLKDDHFDVVMTCYSFLEPEAAERIFPLARARDVGVLTMKPFSGGVIEEVGPALRFVLSTPDIVPIPGSETLEKARQNWNIFTEGLPLSHEDESRIQALRREFDQQFCRRCDYCQPCSENIRVQAVLGLKSIIKRFGQDTQGLEWVKNTVEKARTCTECGDCLPRCPYQLSIPELIRENIAWYDSLEASGRDPR
jgi:predicted aldo/keto reductase-like oxidoreductase